jgi:multiple sugar transport system ATP-binding protein
MAAIELVHLTKSYGAVTAVKDLHLRIEDKEFVAILGPSGCGKSTTMNMIAGVDEPSAGEIRFNGRDVSRVPPGKRGVGFVFQNYAIFTHLSVRQNLAFGLEVRGCPAAEIEERVADTAALMRLAPRLEERADVLNVNELQRLAIGRSAIVRPDTFLLDEPLSNLDAAFRAEMRTELKLLQRKLNQTMIYVTHDQLEAMTMADRVAVMNEGVLQQYSAPLELYNRPVNLFVARFIGSPNMNLLTCRLVQRGDVHWLDFGAAGMLEVKDPELLRQCQSSSSPDLVFGVRPERVSLRPANAGLGGLQMTVTFAERVGPRTLVHLEREGLVVKVAESNGYSVELGEAMTLVVQAGAAQLFDSRTERRLS